jgi:hypothetical protein
MKMRTFNTKAEALAAALPGQKTLSQVVRGGPQWDKAVAFLEAELAAGNPAAKQIAAGKGDWQTRCRYFDGDRRNAGAALLVERAKSLIWWDDTKEWFNVSPPPDMNQVEAPGGWKSDD